MNDVNSKALKWISKNMGITYLDSIGRLDIIQHAVVKLLKEQDRDTRKACANAALESTDEDGDILIDAFNRIIHCRGGIK